MCTYGVREGTFALHYSASGLKHHVHGTTDWMFDIDQVRVADENSKKVLKDDWKFTEVVDWTHASPKKINREVLFPWFMTKRSSFNGDIKGILTQMAPGILGEEE